MQFTKLVPEIYYKDISSGLKTFIDCLEFTVAHEELKSDNPFCVLAKGDVTIMLFQNQEYAEKFKSEERTGTLAALFAGLTIFISCLGLFGLATYMAENRIKEIGIRKVLGASVSGITSLLSKDFLKLVMISFLVACPVSWWMMHKWLEDYPYHVAIQWQVFAFAGIISLLIALITVSYHSIKAAIANPVKSLRTE